MKIFIVHYLQYTVGEGGVVTMEPPTASGQYKYGQIFLFQFKVGKCAFFVAVFWPKRRVILQIFGLE